MNALNQIVQTDHIKVDISIRIGKLRLSVAELSALRENDVVALDGDIGDAVELCVGDHVIATGMLVPAEGDADSLRLRIKATVET
ncbi:MAG: FliM/FliN family flagellar motor C-terminal domain-containing protein [Paracoccus sp. (in: a-proteobacteria)]|nr:FliM/FliN family flagellar motor C-terminal domain-containing protein [Paracoccus sp. (in: a-proteobacteria)]